MPKSERQQKHKSPRRRISVAFAFDLFLIAVLAIVFTVNSQTFAATHNITGGTNGAACNSGGYFNPSALTVNSGDTVTISVPSNDPYAGGLEVHGFPEGNFTIARGGQHTTQALTSNVSYYGTWPSSGCQKGSGTITVSQPAPPPPSPSPVPTPSSSPTSHPSASPTPPPSASTSTSDTSTKHTSPSPSPGTAAKSTSTQNATSVDTPAASSGSVGATTQSATITATMKNVSDTRKSIGFASIVLAAGVTGWIVWRYALKPKKH